MLSLFVLNALLDSPILLDYYIYSDINLISHVLMLKSQLQIINNIVKLLLETSNVINDVIQDYINQYKVFSFMLQIAKECSYCVNEYGLNELKKYINSIIQYKNKTNLLDMSGG